MGQAEHRIIVSFFFSFAWIEVVLPCLTFLDEFFLKSLSVIALWLLLFFFRLFFHALFHLEDVSIEDFFKGKLRAWQDEGHLGQLSSCQVAQLLSNLFAICKHQVFISVEWALAHELITYLCISCDLYLVSVCKQEVDHLIKEVEMLMWDLNICCHIDSL